MQVPVHIDAAERSFDGINSAVLIVVELLKMVVSQIRSLWIEHASTVRIRTGIIALGIFEHPIMHEVCPRLHHGFGQGLFMGFDRTMTICRKGWPA